MEYDLSSAKYDSIIYKEDILKVVSEIEILRHYFPELKLESVTNSPLREDSVPSFGVTFKYRFVCWRDFATGESGNIWSLLTKRYNISFYECLQMVARDFGIIKTFGKQYVKPIIPSSLPTPKDTIKIGIRTREWSSLDKDYWSQYGISKRVLTEYLVSPIDYMFFNGMPVKAEPLSYVYREYKDGLLTFKIYQPLSKDRKWISNNNSSVWEGWQQLPESGEILIITSSRKDVMSIVSTTGISAVSLQAESMFPKQHVVGELKSRFKKVFILYDNDYDNPRNPGRAFGEKLSDSFGLTQIEIPEAYRSKDYSDLVKNKGKKLASEILTSIVTIGVPF